MSRMQPGLETLRIDESPLLASKRIALFTHPSAVDSEFVSAYRRFLAAPNIKLAGFFAPEHGFLGSAPAGDHIDTGTDPASGLPVFSLYGKSYRPTKDMMAQMDVVVIDIQDVGVRYYTYLWTISYILEAAGENHVEVVILDRPNPLSDRLYGLPMYPELESFVGRFNVPVAHGMTLGEIAQMINTRWNPTPAKLTVVRCEGLKRDMWWTDTGREWVATSPAMPHFSTVLHYPGSCLIEGTNLSEGRGTSLPFEIVGAPYINAMDLADHLNQCRLGPVRFRAHYFRPTASKHAGVDCQGIQAHIFDKNEFQPFHAWLGVIREIRNLYPEEFAWTPPHNGVAHFDRLAGSNTVREAIDDGALLSEILRDEPEYIQQFREQRKDYLLY
jgi:uncharacterized protein YbbC (DUF1343 family)